MSLNLYKILPEEISDAEAALLVDVFMQFALAIESHYYGQIRRYHNHIRSLQRDARLRALHHLKGEKSANTEEDVYIQDDEIDF
jgi:hypothetical protein